MSNARVHFYIGPRLPAAGEGIKPVLLAIKSLSQVPRVDDAVIIAGIGYKMSAVVWVLDDEPDADGTRVNALVKRNSL